MGIWGVGVFQNDTGSDIKDEYIAFLQDGMSPEIASQKIIENNQEYLDIGGYDELEFWLALASVQWKYGRLQQEVKEKALALVNGDWHLKEWEKNNSNLVVKRIKEVELFIKHMNSLQPTEKKVKVVVPFTCVWGIGDIFAYQLKSEESLRHNCFNQYIAFQKVANKEAYPKLTIPVLRVAKKVFRTIPTIDVYINEQKLPQFYAPKNYMNNKIHSDLIIHLNDVLYDVAVPVKSLKSYPKNTFFLGNQMPIKQEYLERINDSHELFGWKSFEEVFFMMYDIWKDIDIETLL